MIAFFKRLFSALEETARLRAEVDFLRAERVSDKEKIGVLEKRFLSEVQGNRRRENAQNAIIRTLAKAPGTIPEHAPVAEDAPEPAASGINQPDLFVTDEESIRYVADQFRAQNPQNYETEEQYNALCDAIRKNPENYF